MFNTQENWLRTWKKAVCNSDSKQLTDLLAKSIRPRKASQSTLVADALRIAEQEKDLALLSQSFVELDSNHALKAQALSIALELADEQNPNFASLLKVLTNGEQVLILAHLLEASRLEQDPDKRLLRLSLLLDLIPEDVRFIYWSEASDLASKGGDDAQLLLINLANRLSRKAQRTTFQELTEAVDRLKEPYKHTQATVLLLELGVAPSSLKLKKVFRQAKSIPDPILRMATQNRLEKLLGSVS